MEGALPKRFEPRSEAQPLPPLARAARDRGIGVFQLGSVVRRRTERVLFASFFFFCVTAAERDFFLVSFHPRRGMGIGFFDA